jgi:hypothetical protein
MRRRTAAEILQKTSPAGHRGLALTCCDYLSSLQCNIELSPEEHVINQ